MENLEYVQHGETTGMRDLLTVLFKHKVRIAAVFLVVFLPVLTYSLMTEPLYEAEASIMVKMGREFLNQSEIGSAERAPLMAFNQEEVVNSEIQILSNRDLIEKVITTMKLENIYPKLLTEPSPDVQPLELAIAEFQKNLKVERIKKTNVLKVTFQHTNPRTAALAVNMLVELSKEKHLQVFSDPKSSFLGMQLNVYEQKLQESEKNLQSFKQQKEVFALDEQRTLLLRQRTELDSALKTSMNTIQELQNKIQSFKGQIKTISDKKNNYTNTERDRIIVETKARLLDLQIKEQELLKKYTENNRLVVNVRNEINLTNAFIKEQEKDIAERARTGNPVYQDTEALLIRAEADLDAQKGKSSVLRQQVAELDGKIRALDFTEKEMQKLKRDQSINEKSYQAYMEKVEAARIADDMNRLKLANVSVIQNATTPMKPVKPNVGLNISLALIVGCLLGVGGALLTEATSPSFSTAERVERRLGIPVLATISVKEA